MNHTSLALTWPMKPAASKAAWPSWVRPRPFMWEWTDIRDERATMVEDGGGRAL